MAGIYGWISKDVVSQPGILPNLHPEYVISEEVAKGEFGIVSFRHKACSVKSAKSTCGRYIVSFCGAVFSESFAFSILHGKETARYLADKYAEIGDNLWSHLNGSWLIVVFDSQAHVLKVISDRLGTFPLYYLRKSGQFLFSTSMLALAETAKTLDIEGVLEFISLGRSLDDKTILNDVKFLDAATILTYSQGSFYKQSYWCPDLEPDNSLKDVREVAEHIGVLVSAAVERTISPKIGLAVTGGLDSRQLATRLIGRCHKACVFGTDDCLEVKSAVRLCAELNIDVLSFHYTPADLGQRFEEYIKLNDGFIITPEYFLITKELAKKGCDQAMIGFHGGSMRGSCGCPTSATFNDIDEILREKYHNQTRDYLMLYNGKKAFGTKVPTNAYHIPYENYRKVFDGIKASTIYNRFVWFNIIERQRRRTPVALGAGRAFLPLVMPYVDVEFVNFMLKIPPWMKSPKVDVYKRALINHSPDIAALPNALGSNYVSEISMFSLKKKIWYMIPKPIRARVYTKVAYRSLSPTPKTAYQTSLAKPLRENLGVLVETGILNKKYVNKLLDKHFSGKDSKESWFHKLIPLGYIIDKYGLKL